MQPRLTQKPIGRSGLLPYKATQAHRAALPCAAAYIRQLPPPTTNRSSNCCRVSVVSPRWLLSGSTPRRPALPAVVERGITLRRRGRLTAYTMSDWRSGAAYARCAPSLQPAIGRPFLSKATQRVIHHQHGWHAPVRRDGAQSLPPEIPVPASRSSCSRRCTHPAPSTVG